MASLSLAKIRGKIINSKLVLQLEYIINKLRETVGKRLKESSYLRATELYERYVAIGIFEWAPRARSWFYDQSYVLWLGLCSTEPFQY